MTVLFQDDFNRADGALGADWTVRGSAEFSITSNRAVRNETVGDQNNCAYHATASYGTADYAVQAVHRTQASIGALGGFSGVVGRRVNNGATDSDGYILFIQTGAPSGYAYLYRRQSGSYSMLVQSSAFDVPQNTDFLLRLEMEGTALRGYVDGTLRVSTTDAGLSAEGDAGLQLYGAQWDDFLVEDFAGGGGPEALTCNPGSIAITGTTATLLRRYALSCQPGAVAIVGTTATLRRIFALSATPGAVTVAGTTATLRRVFALSATAGAVTIAGTTATLRHQRRLTAQAGALTITGSTATLTRARSLVADPGAVTITGTTATLRMQRRLTAQAGALVIAAPEATLTYSGSSNIPAASGPRLANVSGPTAHAALVQTTTLTTVVRSAAPATISE